MPDPTPIISSLGRIATRQQLIASGCSGYDLTRAVRAGRIRRVRQARYATPDAPPDALAATRVGGLVAGPSAAHSYGLWAGFDTRLHVSVGANSSRLRTNIAPGLLPPRRRLTPDSSGRSVVLHWLVGGAVPELGPECWRVSLSVCLRQMVEWSDPETAVACLDTALSVQKLSRRKLMAFFADASAPDRLIAGQCRAGSDSGTESLARQRLEALGIAIRQQVKISGVGRVDIGVVGTRIIIEVDSRKHHDDPDAFERDRWRDAELVSRGYVVIRLSYLRVTADWPWCVRTITGAIVAQT